MCCAAMFADALILTLAFSSGMYAAIHCQQQRWTEFTVLLLQSSFTIIDHPIVLTFAGNWHVGEVGVWGGGGNRGGQGG